MERRRKRRRKRWLSPSTADVLRLIEIVELEVCFLCGRLSRMVEMGGGIARDGWPSPSTADVLRLTETVELWGDIMSTCFLCGSLSRVDFVNMRGDCAAPSSHSSAPETEDGPSSCSFLSVFITRNTQLVLRFPAQFFSLYETLPF